MLTYLVGFIYPEGAVDISGANGESKDYPSITLEGKCDLHVKIQ